MARLVKLRYRREGERFYLRIAGDVPDEARVWKTLTLMGAPIHILNDPKALIKPRFVPADAFPKLQRAAKMMRATLSPEAGEAPIAEGAVGVAYEKARPVDVAALVRLVKEDPDHALGPLRSGRTELATWARANTGFAREARRDLKALDEALDSLKQRQRRADKERAGDEARTLSAALRGVNASDIWKAKKELALLKERADAFEPTSLPDAEITRIPGFDGKLRPYQLAGVRFLVGRDMRAILADEMGLGKTIMAIAAVLATDQRALVVGPANVLYNWVDEIERFTGHLPMVYHQRTFTGPRDARFLITTYDALRSIDPEHHEITSRDVLILDEAHYVRNPTTLRARLVKALPIARRVLLTGTPLVNGLEDYYELLEQADHERFASRSAFQRTWTVDASLFNKYAAVRHVAAELLQRATRDVLLRRRKADVLTELPERVITVTKHDLDRRDRGIYSNLEAKAVDTLRNANSDVAVFSAFHAMRHHLATARVPAVLERVRELLDNDECVVVYSHYLEPLQKLHEKLGPKIASRLDGSTPPKMRQQLARTFGQRDDPDDPESPFVGPRVLLAQMEAGGIGLNFTAGRYVLFVHLGWTPAVHAQAMDRVHRIGQDRTVFVEFFVTPDTIDERIVKILLRKEADQNLVLSEGQDLLNRKQLMALMAEDAQARVAAADGADASALAGVTRPAPARDDQGE